jgi:flagellin-like protein
MKFLLKQKKRSAVSPVIATLLLIAIAVAAAIIVYAFVTGLIGGLSSGSSSNLITATAALSVPSGSGAGLLVVSVTNNANSPITGIQVQYSALIDTVNTATTCMGETVSGLACNGVAASTPNVCGSTNALNVAAKGISVPFCNATPAPIDTSVVVVGPPALAAGASLPVGSEVSATDQVLGTASAPLTTGTSYTMSIIVDFANGSTHTQVLTATAQI